MKLGPLSLENNLILAPMQNVTTGPYRRFCRRFSTIGLVCVPMLYTKRLMNNPKSIENVLHKIENERPISVQLIGRDLEALKEAIECLESYKIDVLDINAGCPSKRALTAREGGFLLNDLKRMEELLQTASKYSSRPISLKTRIGFDNTDNLNEFVKIINDSNISFLTLHARTVKAYSDDTALDLDSVKKFKEKLTMPIVGNGDITNPESAKKFKEVTNVDALMIGRGAIGNPKIFHQVSEYILNDKKIPAKNNKRLMEKRVELYEEVLDDFIEGITLSYHLDLYKFKELKRNTIWLSKNIEDSTQIRTRLSKTKSLDQLRSVLDKYFND